MSLKKTYSKTKPTCKVTFTLDSASHVEHAEHIYLLGDFNEWKPENAVELSKKGTVFSASVDLAVGQDYEYRYLIDGHHWMNDPEADKYVPTEYLGVFNSVVTLDKPAKKAAPKKAAKKAAPKAKAKKEAFSDPKEPAAKKSAKKATSKAKKDNLKIIEGVGPKIEGLLREAGFETYGDIAKAAKKDLQAILDKAGKRFQMHDPSTWAQQAKLAAKGDKAALKTLQDKLKGGKKVSKK